MRAQAFFQPLKSPINKMWRETKILLIDDDRDRRRDLTVILNFLSEDHLACPSSEWQDAVAGLESSRVVNGVMLGM